MAQVDVDVEETFHHYYLAYLAEFSEVAVVQEVLAALVVEAPLAEAVLAAEAELAGVFKNSIKEI